MDIWALHTPGNQLRESGCKQPRPRIQGTDLHTLVSQSYRKALLALLVLYVIQHVMAEGLSSSILCCLLTLFVYTYCQRYQQQSHGSAVTHPVSTTTLNSNKRLDK